MRQQAKQYYYIDRKLVSNDQNQVIEGMRQLQLFLPSFKATDILNSIVMRLMDLYWTSKVSYIKITAASLLCKCKSELLKLPSKQQIMSILHKCLKSQDPFFRILTIRTISQISSLFLKQNSVYHLLLSRLRKDQNSTVQEKLTIISCLSTLLCQSEHLSKLFSNNVSQLVQLGGIQLSHILYLSLHANFQTHAYPKIINELWVILENESNKKTKYYFGRLLKKAASSNFVCYIAFKQIFNQFNKQSTCAIEYLQYDFYEKQSNYQICRLSDQELLDFTYIVETKKYLQIVPECEEELSNRVKNAILNKNVTFNHLLMTYYCQQCFDDDQLLIVGSHGIKWIKAALVTCNFKLAYNLILTQLKQSVQYCSCLILMASYCCLHIQPVQNNLQLFLEAMNNIGSEYKVIQLVQLCKIWARQYGQSMQSQMKMQDPIQKFNEQFEYIATGNRSAPKRMDKMPFGKIYFGKKSIQLIFKLLHS